MSKTAIFRVPRGITNSTLDALKTQSMMKTPISGTYFEVMDKSRVSIHVTKPYPAERRRKQSEWAKVHGMKGNLTTNGQNVHLRSNPHFEELSRMAVSLDFLDVLSD